MRFGYLCVFVWLDPRRDGEANCFLNYRIKWRNVKAVEMIHDLFVCIRRYKCNRRL